MYQKKKMETLVLRIQENKFCQQRGMHYETDCSLTTPERNKSLLIPLFMSCETLERNSSCLVLNFLSIEL